MLGQVKVFSSGLSQNLVREVCTICFSQGCIHSVKDSNYEGFADKSLKMGRPLFLFCFVFFVFVFIFVCLFFFLHICFVLFCFLIIFSFYFFYLFFLFFGMLLA